MFRQSLSLLAVVVVLSADFVEAGVFRRRRMTNATQMTYEVQIPSHADTEKTLSLDDKILGILNSYNFQHGLISDRLVSFDAPENFVVGNQWAKVQRHLEEFFRSELHLEFKPQLMLVVIEGRDGSARFAFTNPGDERIIAALVRTLGVSREMFSQQPLIGEYGSFELNDFKGRFLAGDDLDTRKIRAEILELLQGNKDLAAIAKEARGAIKPIPSINDLSATRARVVTAWQEFSGNENLRVSWRVYVKVEKQSEHEWTVESLVEIGQRYRSQSYEQIERISDLNRLSAYENLRSDTIRGVPSTIVRKKGVFSSAEALLSNEDRQILGEFAPMLWNSVKKTLIRTE